MGINIDVGGIAVDFKQGGQAIQRIRKERDMTQEQLAEITNVDAGVTDFYSGGADGVDCWASLIVLELRKK